MSEHCTCAIAAIACFAFTVGCGSAPRRGAGSEVTTISVVVAPGSLDAAIEDVRLTNGNVGRHYACFPASAERWNGLLLLYIIGTDDDPSETYELAEYACGHGFAAIAPMYKNAWRPPDACRDDASCYERARREIIEGKDLAPDPISVDAANSLWHRIDTLVEHLSTRAPRIWKPIRDRVIHRDLTRVVLAGFSQGSGHVPLIAHDFEVARVIMLGGVQDRVHQGTRQHGPVDWIARWRTSSPATPGDRFYAFNHASDDRSSPDERNANYDALGVPNTSCDFNDQGYRSGCHRITIPAVDCRGKGAHATPVVRTFGSTDLPCKLDGPRWSTAATWRYLLTLPIATKHDVATPANSLPTTSHH